MLYLAQLERFGYVLTAVAKTEKEARDIIIKEYIRAYQDLNNTDPATDMYYDESYLKTAENEISVTAFSGNECKWL